MQVGNGTRRATTAAALATLLVLSLAGGVPSSLAAAVTDPAVAAPAVLRVDPSEATRAPVWDPDDVPDDHASGAVHDGLAETRRCTGGFAVEDPPAGGHTHPSPATCSHGPDEAPVGVDVRDQPTVAELRLRAATDTAAAGEAGGTASEAGAVPCYGDGSDGRRLQAVYAVAADRPDRFASVAPLIAGYAATADQAFATSAARDGGVRHLRWVTDSGCALSVLHVVLSPTGDDSLGNTRAELFTQGLGRTDRKYVVWTDAAVYCGIAYVVGDSRPDASNPANSGPTFARIDTACWGYSGSVEAHEIAHMLGAVQLSAPNSNGAWHCTDESDRLCYDDGSGASLNYLCASAGEPMLDCNGDDYFNVAPVAGSWLATHWNLASSLYLEIVEGAGPAPGPLPVAPGPDTPVPPTPTVTATPDPPVIVLPPVPPPVAPDPTSIQPTVPTGPTSPPAPTSSTAAARRVTSTFTVRLPQRTVRVRVQAAAGPLSVTARFAGAGRVLLGARDTDQDRLVSQLRRSGKGVVTPVPAGRYVVTVSGRPGTRVTLRVARLVR